MTEVTVVEVVEVNNPNMEVATVTLAASADTYTCKKLTRAVGVLLTADDTTISASDALTYHVSGNVVTIYAANTTNPTITIAVFGY